MKKNKNTLLPIIMTIIISIIVIIIIIIIYFHNKNRHDSYNNVRSLININQNYKLTNFLLDMIICGTSNEIPKCPLNNNKLKGVINNKKLWPQNSIITVKFLEIPHIDFKILYKDDIFPLFDGNGIGDENKIKYDPLEFEMNHTSNIIGCIKEIIEERYQRFTNLTFDFMPLHYTGDADIKISFNPKGGCNSLVGTDCRTVRNPNTKTMNFSWFSVGTVLHEFGHALGLEHEHQSPFGNIIKWNSDLLYDHFLITNGWDKTKVDNNIIKPLDEKIYGGTQYDKDSIMHYFYPKELTKDSVGSKQNVRLSPIDVKYIASLYSISDKIRPQNKVYPERTLKMGPINFYKYVYGEDITDINFMEYVPAKNWCGF